MILRILTPVHQLGRKLYQRLPEGQRDQLLVFGYRFMPCLFHGLPHFHEWRWRNERTRRQHNRTTAGLYPLNRVPQSRLAAAWDSLCLWRTRIAIHLHIYYPDLAPEFAERLQHMPTGYNLFVSVTDAASQQACQQAFGRLPRCRQLTIRIVANRGRDIAPLVCTFGRELLRHDLIAHLHSKKSPHSESATDGWRQYLLTTLLDNPSTLRRMLRLLQTGHSGIVYPQNFHKITPSVNTWRGNRTTGMALCRRWGITPPRGYFDFPAGSMFWARSDALRPLLDAGFTFEDFPPEAGQVDGTLAHALERMLVLVTRRQGYRPAIIADDINRSWSPWRVEQVLQNPVTVADPYFNDPEVECIGFSLFDTLLTRPVLNAGSTPENADNADNAPGRRDLAGIRARKAGLALYRRALASGRRIVLLEDTDLPYATIAQTLLDAGIRGWSKLYLSSETGRRKDSGELYELIWAHEKIEAQQFCMVGTSDYADRQIPQVRNAHVFGILSPIDAARAQPLLRPVLECFERSTSAAEQRTLALVLQTLFDPIHYPHLDPEQPFAPRPWLIGYAVLGPWLAAFGCWLHEQVQNDDIQHLYFMDDHAGLLDWAFFIATRAQSSKPTCHHEAQPTTAVDACCAAVSLVDCADHTKHPQQPTPRRSYCAMTTAAGAAAGKRQGRHNAACFHQNVSGDYARQPLMYRRRALLHELLATPGDMADGALAYVDDARRLAAQLPVGFRPAATVADALFAVYCAMQDGTDHVSDVVEAYP